MTTVSTINKCLFDKFCTKKDCSLAHSQKVCKFDGQCTSFFCQFRHSDKNLLCIAGHKCEDQNCQHTHPKDEDYCKNKENCFYEKCCKAHTRIWCSYAIKCNNYDCTKRQIGRASCR